ncbi:uncharacterized protein [Procambarus clarkii]|uniref:uncharacterized protein n=1 Tax=Procambarus clarkii TaxID=6728 RepID=UPI0037445115
MDEEKDLRVRLHHSLNVAQQVGTAVKRANQTLGIIKRTFTFKENKVIVQLYKSLVHLHLDYCIQAWRPYLHKDIAALEKVQHRATKIIPEFSHLSYQERLRATGLTTLQTRHDRTDLSFKILNNLVDVDPDNAFRRSDVTRTRSKGFKLNKFNVGLKTGDAIHP